MKIQMRHALIYIITSLFFNVMVHSHVSAAPGDLVNDGGKPKKPNTRATGEKFVDGGFGADAVCEGEDCAPDISDISSSAASVAITSPFGHIYETMNSNKTTESISSPGYANSPLAASAVDWYLTDGTLAAGIMKAFEFSMKMADLRYQSDQAIQSVLLNNGAEGRRIWEAYSGCVTFLTKRGTSLGAAQESCLGQWESASGTGGREPAILEPAIVESVRLNDARLSFDQHLSHPLNKINTGVTGFFIDSPTRDQIRLTHLIFTNPVRMAGGNGDVRNYLSQLYQSWLKIFGDIIIKQEAPALTQAAYFGSSSVLVKPSFTYMDGIGSAGITNAPDPFATNQATPFLQWARFRQDVVYYNLMTVMSKYCRHVKTNQTANQNATVDFWKPDSNSNNPNIITMDELRSISPSFQDMSKVDGELLYKFIDAVTGFRSQIPDQSTTQGPTQDVCDSIDPSKTGSKATLAIMSEYFGDTRYNDRFAGPMKFIHQLSGAIATSQINEVFREFNRVVMVISGGNFEDYARRSALDLMQSSVGGQWDYMEALRSSQAAYIQGLQQAEQWANASSVSPKGGQ